MSVTFDAQLRTSLRSVLEHAGLAVTATADELSLDLRGLDRVTRNDRHDKALRTAAGLLLCPGKTPPITAQLPEHHRGRRALAASGMMFALAERHAQVADPTHHESRHADGAETGDWALFATNTVDRLTRFESWRDAYTPFDYELRKLMLDAGASPATSHDADSGLGVFDHDFVGFVNPHYLAPGTELRAIAGVASPWFARLLNTPQAARSATVATTMEILGHALDNIRDHAFSRPDRARSLVTMGVVTTGSRSSYQVQILDNGIGIPASIGRQMNEPVTDLERACSLVNQVVHGGGDDYEDVLPPGRNLGLPAMRVLAGELGGELTITTAGPNGTQIVMECVGSQPSYPTSDLIPVAGTVINLRVPLPDPPQQRSSDQTRPVETLDL